MDYVLWLVVFVGHLAVWCVIFNRIHATAFPRQFRKLTEKFVIAAVVSGFLWFLGTAIVHGTVSITAVAEVNLFNRVYLLTCFLAGVFFTLRWIYRKFVIQPVAAIVDHQTKVIDVAKLNDQPVYVGKIAKWLERIPGNQSHLIAIEQMTLALKNLPSELNGLKICQLSDFHLTGHIDIGYYQRIVEQVNRFNADLVLITGDLVDEVKCLDWIDEVFGKFKSRCGVFYVLGNHDKRVPDETMLRKRLADAGLVSVNGQWHTIDVDGQSIAIAGNELPWYRGAESLKPYRGSDRQEIPLTGGAATAQATEPGFDRGLSAGPSGVSQTGDVTGGQPTAMPLKILLSHSPDQLIWAADFDFDLMLAGHTHGGQIQLPVIGPIVAPSRFGIKYASGTFMIDKMLMHVSRGIAGDECIRINCKPEVGFFTLIRPEN